MGDVRKKGKGERERERKGERGSSQFSEVRLGEKEQASFKLGILEHALNPSSREAEEG